MLAIELIPQKVMKLCAGLYSLFIVKAKVKHGILHGIV